MWGGKNAGFGMFNGRRLGQIHKGDEQGIDVGFHLSLTMKGVLGKFCAGGQQRLLFLFVF
jgi:hypothetical protein